MNPVPDDGERRVRISARSLIASPVPRPDEVAELHELRADFDRLLSALLPREAAIVRGYFGLGAGEGSTLGELSRRFGVSVERVRQIKNKALRKLRHPLRRTKPAAYVGIYSADEYARFVEAESASAREASAARGCLLRRIGDPIGDFGPEVHDHLRQSIASTLSRATSRDRRRIRSASELVEYFSEHRDLRAALSAWKRDVSSGDGGPLTLTRAVVRDGSFMLYARRHRRTWYLCETAGGLLWVGFAARAEAP